MVQRKSPHDSDLWSATAISCSRLKTLLNMKAKVVTLNFKMRLSHKKERDPLALSSCNPAPDGF